MGDTEIQHQRHRARLKLRNQDLCTVYKMMILLQQNKKRREPGKKCHASRFLDGLHGKYFFFHENQYIIVQLFFEDGDVCSEDVLCVDCWRGGDGAKYCRQGAVTFAASTTSSGTRVGNQYRPRSTEHCALWRRPPPQNVGPRRAQFHASQFRISPSNR